MIRLNFENNSIQFDKQNVDLDIDDNKQIELKQIKIKDNIALLICYHNNSDLYETIMYDLILQKKISLEIKFKCINIMNHNFDF